MKPQQWLKIEEIFGEALKLDGSTRQRFVSSACGDDEVLCREIKELLEEDCASDFFLEDTPALGSAWRDLLDAKDDESVLTPADSLPEHTRIGPYWLLEKLGEGGMGVVYLAARKSQPNSEVREFSTPEVIPGRPRLPESFSNKGRDPEIYLDSPS